MRNWLLMLATLSVPCFGATLKGVVTDDHGIALYKTRIIVTHDLSLLISHAKRTDFNGLYHFDLNPGPYRILVLKAGYQPQLARVLILSEHEEIQLEHALLESKHVSALPPESRTTKIKEAYRRSNMQPFQEAELGLESPAAPVTVGQLSGSVAQEAQQDLAGQLWMAQDLHIQTSLTNRVALESVVRRSDPAQGQEVRSISSTLSGTVGGVAVDVKAEDHRGTDPALGLEQAAAVQARYGQQIEALTHLGLLRSHLPETEHTQVAWSQEATVRPGDHTLSLVAEVVSWKDQGSTFAHHQLLGSTWQPSQTPWLSVVLGWRDIETPENHFRFGEIELQGRKAQMGPFDLASRVGFTEASDAVTQDHRLSADFGQLTMSSGYADRRSHSALRSEDVYGNFSPSPQTPGWTEAFLAQRERIAEFGADWGPNNRWQHRMTWSQSQRELELLYAGVANRFLASASHRQTNLTYELDSPEHGSKLILSRQGDVLGSTLSASVAHRLLPFRDKEKAIHLHLTWQNRQSYPLWWLLAQETPNQTDAWYQGRLAFQF